MEQQVKGLWASRAEQAGWAEIRRLAEFLLYEICARRSVDLPRDTLRLSRRWIERFAIYRVVNQRRNDRKGFDDAKPRIQRDWTDLAPMERVVADVKHLDVIVTREDGSTAWPKIVAFMDAGTGRAFAYPVLLAPGEGVRQEHVIEAFLAMVSHPDWGFPQGLYLDNGVEFGALTKIDAALRSINNSGVRTLIYARPYNAAAKPIESLFARLDRYVFALLPGYAGPNRMAKKTQSVGKPPTPFHEGWERFASIVEGLVEANNRRPVGGLWRNRSPEQWFDAKRASGWRPLAIDTLALDAAFANYDARRIDRGVVKVKAARYTHPALAALPSRTVVDIALPWRRGAAPLARIQGEWKRLSLDAPFPARWVEGAKESDRRQAAQRRHVAKLARDAASIDPVETKLRWSNWAAVSRTEVASAAPQRMDLGDDLRQLGAALQPIPPAPRPSAQDLKRAREMAITERLEQVCR